MNERIGGGDGKINRRGFLIASVLGLAGGAAALAGLSGRGKDGDDVALDGGRDAVSQNENDRKFNEYTPPPEGVIVKKFFKPGNKKTIIYIADEHPVDGADKQRSPRPFQVQRELYLIIEDLIRKYGEVSIVLENWPIGLTTGHVLDERGDTFVEAGQDPDGSMRRIIAERDPLRRIAIARQAVGNNIVPGSMFAVVAYPERVIPIGSVTMDELERVNALTGVISEASHIIDHPSEVECSNQLTFAQAKDAFQRGKRGRSIVDCYCAVRHNVMAMVDAFSADRFEIAPRRELTSAFAVFDAGSEFAVVAAGVNHIPESLKILDQRGDTNYIVISPKAMEEMFPKALSTPLMPPVKFEDDKDGTCEKRVRELKDEQERRLIKEFLRDDEEEL